MTVTETSRPDLDAVLGELLFTAEGRSDPLPRGAAIREGARIFQSGIGPYVVARYEDCQTVLRDPRFVKQGTMEQRVGDDGSALGREQPADRTPSMLFLDPPDHTRLRGLVSKAFTPRTVEALRPHLVRLADELLDDVAEPGAGNGDVDVLAALAFPFPVTVIGELIGIPEPDRAQFQPLVRATTATLEMVVTPEQLRAADDAFLTMRAYLADLVEQRRRRPADDLLSRLLAVEEQGDRLTTEELISTLLLVFAAGFETTTNLIGNGLLALLRHPDQLVRLRADPSLLPSAVDEMLRFDGPVQMNARATAEPVAFGDVTVPVGSMVVALTGAANHDPRRFDNPDVFDVGRGAGSGLAFGAGIHHCIGAALARAEGQVVFGRLLERFGTIELRSDDLVWRDSLTLRGLEALPVHLEA